MPRKKLGYIDYFIHSVGISSHEGLSLASVLFKSVDDCHDFYISFLGNNRNIIDDLLDYREKKIYAVTTGYAEFVYQCQQKSTKIAFEKMFLQKFTDEHIELIENAIASKRVSLDHIYTSFYNNVNENIMKHVL